MTAPARLQQGGHAAVSPMQLRPPRQRCLTSQRRPGSAAVSACLRCGQPLVGRGEARQLRVSATKSPQQQEHQQQQQSSTQAETESREAPEGNEPPQQQSAGVRFALALLRLYKNGISPLLPPSCRYLPTCSAYAMEAYQEYGVGKGTVLTAWRLMRCNPLGSSGYDPVRWPPPGLEWVFKS